MISQPVASVKPRGILISAKQRLFRTRVDGHICTAKFNRVESVSRPLLHIDVSGNDSDRGYINLRSAQCHDESDRIIGSCIGVDEKRARHGR
jgi:hypothetical protein